MRSNLSQLFLLLMVLAPASLLRAEISVSMPLEGYYRIGRYMPLIVSTDRPGETVLRGEGLLPVSIAGGPVSSVFLPVLVIAPPSGEIEVVVNHGVAESMHLGLMPLGENERLVGLIGVTDESAGGLFPGKTAIPLRLDSPPLRGAAVAWETLDAIVCDGVLPATMDSVTVEALLAGGVMIAVRSADAPDAVWPWRREGAFWVLRHDPVGPTAVVSEAAYTPVAGWSPGQSARTRGQAMAFGVIFAIAMLATTLLRGGRRLAAMAGIVLISLVVIAKWSSRLPTMASAGGNVVTLPDRNGGNYLLQTDGWLYSVGLRESVTPPRWGGNVRPMLYSAEQASRLGMKLEIAGDGKPIGITARLAPGMQIAWLFRSIARDTTVHTALQRDDSPLQRLVRDLYIVPGVRAIGQGSPGDHPDEWPTVFLERSTP